MKTKLTLSIDKDLVQFGRKQAMLGRESISGMFSAFLQDRQKYSKRKSAPTVQDMVGSLKAYQINDSKDAIRTSYTNKHLN